MSTQLQRHADIETERATYYRAEWQASQATVRELVSALHMALGYIAMAEHFRGAPEDCETLIAVKAAIAKAEATP